MNIDRIKEALNTNAEEFIRWLLPAGKKRGDRWLVGSVDGEAGKSLTVCITGPRVGMFCDFATGQRGSNLIELYLRTRNAQFDEAVRNCEDWLRGSVTPRGEIVGSLGGRKMCGSAASEACAIKAIPSFALREWEEGAEHLFSNPVVAAGIGRARGWPIDFTFHAIETGLISMPKYGAERGVAFQVVAPEIEAGRIVRKLIGYHIRINLRGAKPAWRYVPNESQHDQRTPALPMVLGDFESAELIVITEGEWDALTFSLAAGWLGEGCYWPKEVALIGIRGASSVNVFLQYYRPFWPTRRVNCLVLVDADQAGSSWSDGPNSFATKLSAISTKVVVVDCAPHKDFNDLYLEASPTSDDIAQLLTSHGIAIQGRPSDEKLSL